MILTGFSGNSLLQKIGFYLIVTILFSGITTADDKPVQVNYRLKWLFNTSVVGDLYAREYGYFDRAGISVNIKEGGPERDAIKELELGYAHFGIASADQVIRARSKGAPVLVIAQLFQINPLQWVYRKDTTQINTLKDLKGKTIGITYGGNDETIMRTLLTKENIAEKDVTLFSVRYDYTPFYKKRVDIWPVYRNSQGITLGDQLGAEGEPVGFLDPARFGIKFVANSVVTSEKMMMENPELVKKFILTLLKAWEDAFKSSNQQKSLDLLEKYDKETAPNVRKRQLDITRDFVKPSLDIPIGRIDVDGWRQTESIMLKQNQIKKPVSVVNILKTEFVPVH